MTQTLDRSKTIQKLEKMILEHDGWEVMEDYGRLLKSRIMSRDQLKVYFANQMLTAWDVPPGILALTVKISDDWMNRDAFASHGVAAKTLFAGIHEYGLHAPERLGIAKHHFLLLKEAHLSWGFDAEELHRMKDGNQIWPEARALASCIYDFMRLRPVGQGVGAHMAIEVTADREWGLNYEAFSHLWKEYGLSGPDDPAVGFYGIHNEQEPIHASLTSEVAELYSNIGEEKDVVIGISTFMDVWAKWIYVVRDYVANV
jgi:hypothetical protein